MPATTITWRDVLELPEDGNRYEAIGGALHVSPPPKLPHQWVSARLFAALLVRPTSSRVRIGGEPMLCQPQGCINLPYHSEPDLDSQIHARQADGGDSCRQRDAR